MLPERPFGYDAEARGVLGGDPTTGCLWLEDAGSRRQVLLVGDFEVDWAADPPAIERDGQPFAELGEDVHVAGGGEDGQGVPGCPVSPAGGNLWLISSRIVDPVEG